MFFKHHRYSEDGQLWHHPQSPIEITLMVITPIYQSFACSLIASLQFPNIGPENKNHLVKRFILEFFLIILPLILDLTIFADQNNYFVHIIFAFVVFFCLYFLKNEKTKLCDNNTYKSSYFIVNMRSTINMIAVGAILAVDFVKVFPTRFKKTELYGYSLMDIGVGLYVFSNGVVAPELSREKQNSLVKSLIGSIPILGMGLIRLVLVTLTNYHVSVTEYGVHWNFFMTLASTKILSSIILKFVKIEYSLYTTIIILGLHEYLLYNGLADWVLDPLVERNNIISSNREGIVSALGYVGLYFLSITIGKIINPRHNKSLNQKKLVINLVKYTLILLIITYLCDHLFGNSRRLASTGYCTWVGFMSCIGGLLFTLSEHCLENIYRAFSIKNPTYLPLVFDAVNYNGLLFFLLANVLTGLLNLFVISKKEDAPMVIFILSLYMIFNCGLMIILFKLEIRTIKYLNNLVNLLSKRC